MRYFRRLPPFLRVVSILGMLFWLALVFILALFVASITSWASSPQPLMDSFRMAGAPRMVGIGLNLFTLGQACYIVIFTHARRFRQPDGGPFLFDSWQSQAQALALLAALPVCALTLVAITPPTQRNFGLAFMAFMVTMLAWLELPVAYLWVLNKIGAELMRTSRPQ